MVAIRNFDDVLFEAVTVSRTPVEAYLSMQLSMSLSFWRLVMTGYRAARSVGLTPG